MLLLLDQIRVLVESALGHAHQNVRPAHIREMNESVGNDHLGAARTAAGLGSIGLSQGAFLVVDEACGFSHNLAGQHNALAAKTRNDDFHLCTGIRF